MEKPAPDWVPDACTLPTPEQPLRVAEFDALFATSLRSIDRPAPTRLRLTLADVTNVEDLIARETACCSFFTFTLQNHVLDVEVPPSHTKVLDALAARATAELGERP